MTPRAERNTGVAGVERGRYSGYQPEFGARELKRQVCQIIETKLAKDILADELTFGDHIEVDYDKASGEGIER